MFYGKSWIGVSVEHFTLQLNNYVEWYNEKRIENSLGGKTVRASQTTGDTDRSIVIPLPVSCSSLLLLAIYFMIYS